MGSGNLFCCSLFDADVRRRRLRRHGYPPDKQEKTTRTVLEQAEVLSEGWATA